ncbi:MAG: hypothetical protein FJ299_05830 [Planctomycetes bacterium]|nr:hypothetical protein [Planctomycetota bacterium]
MFPLLRHVALFTLLGAGTFALPTSAQTLELGLHKKFGSKVDLDLRYVIGGPRGKHHYGKMQRWVPGRYECVEERFWVPGTCERVWVPARYELAYDECGRPYRRLICAGRWETIEHPGYWEVRPVRRWIEGYWVTC